MKIYLILPLLVSVFSCALSAESLDQAKSLMETKKYQQAADVLEKLLKDDGNENDEILYYAARALYLDKKYTDARSKAKKIATEHKDSKWLTKARFLIADCYFQEDTHKKAASIYKELLKDTLKLERKIEIVNKLTVYAQNFSAEKKEDGIVVERPNYEAAYQIYKEVLAIECGEKLREQTRLKMLKVRQDQKNYNGVKLECLDYLAEFDKDWRGEIGSVERISSTGLKRFITDGTSVALVRFALSESLHRMGKRKLANVYLNELIKQIKAGKLNAPTGLLADSQWLRLHALCHSGGKPLNFDYWMKEVRSYLKDHPTHIHADRTAFLLPEYEERWGDKDQAKKLYREYADNGLGAKLVKKPETVEVETDKGFIKRQQDAAVRQEKALLNLGEMHSKAYEFEQSKEVWNESLTRFPNGGKWPLIQKKIAQLEYKKLIHTISELPTDKDIDTTIQKATEAIDAFVSAHPLHDKLVDLLYKRGSIPYTLAEKKLEDEQLEKAKSLYILAIEQWAPLLQRFPDRHYAGKAYEKSGSAYLHQLGEQEKGVELLKRSGTTLANQLISSLDAEVINVQTPRSFTLEETPFVEMNSRNVEKVTVKQYWMDAKSYWRKSPDIEQAVNLDLDLIEPDKSWEFKILDYKEKKDIKSKIELPFEQGKPGVCVIKVESENFESSTLVMRGNLDLVVSASEKDLIAFVKNAVTNKPVANASVMVASEEEIILEGKTDASGLFYSTLKLPENHSSYRVLVSNREGVASSHISSVFSSTDIKDDLFSFLGGAEQPSVRAWFLVDREEAREGDTVNLSAVIRENKDGKFSYPSERDYKLEIRAGSVRLMSKEVTFSKEGFLSENVRIPLATKVSSISYSLTQNKDKKIILNGTKELTKQSELLGSAVISFEKSYAKEGDVLQGTVTASYRHGGPIADSKFKLNLPRGIELALRTDENGEAKFTYDTLADLAGSSLSFSANFSTMNLYTPLQYVVLDPVDLTIEAKLSHSTTTVGKEIQLSSKTTNFKDLPIGSELKVELFKLTSSEDLDILSGRTKLYKKSEIVETLNLTTDFKTGEVKHTFTLEEEGDYHFKISGKDQYGVNAIDAVTCRVIGDKSKDKIILYRENSVVFDDQELSMQLFSNLSQPTPVVISFETHRSIKRKLITLKQGLNNINLKLDSRYSPGFRMRVLAIDEREFFSSVIAVDVSTKLNIEANYVGIDKDAKAEAGSKLKAKLKITDSSGQIVPAIVLATLNPSNLSELEEITTAKPIFEDYNYQGEFEQHSSCGFSIQGKQQKRLVFSDENIKSVRSSNMHAFVDRNNANRIAKILYKGEGYYNLGLFDQAEQEFNKILRLDPYHQGARSWLSNVDLSRKDYYRSAYDETRARKLAEHDQAWQLLPLLEDPASVSRMASQSVMGVLVTQRKMNSIIIPRIEIENATIEAAVDMLSKLARDNDPETDVNKKGVNLVIRVRGAEELRVASLQLQNVPLGEALRQICLQCEPRLRVKVEDYVVAIVPATDLGSSETFNQTFDIPQDLLKKLGISKNDPAIIQEAFESMGVRFPGNSRIRYIPATLSLVVTNTAIGLNKIDQIIQSIGEADDIFGGGDGIFGGGGNNGNGRMNAPVLWDRGIDGGDSINFFLNNPSTNHLLQSAVTSNLPVWHSNLITLSDEQELTIPLPEAAGAWKLDLHGFDEESRKAHSNLLIHTTAPYSLHIDTPAYLIEGDSFAPRVEIFRENDGKEEKVELSIRVKSGEVERAVNKQVTFAKGSLAQTVALEKLTGVRDQLIEISTESAALNLKKESKISIVPWGPLSSEQKSLEVPAGQAKFLNLEIPKDAKAQYLSLSVIPHFDECIIQLALGASIDPFCFSPIEDTHPSGSLLGITAAIEYLEKNKVEHGEAIENLRERGGLLVGELVTLMKREGYWTKNSGTSFANDWTTAFSYIALKRWSKLGAIEDTPVKKAEQWLLERAKAIDINQLENRALVQMALAYGDASDFSECNRLLRNSGKLSSTAKLFLAKVFTLQERTKLAQDLINEVFSKEIGQWNAKDEIAKRPSFMLGLALEVLAAVENSPQPYIELKQKLLELNQQELSNSYVKASVVSGLAAIQQKLAKQAGLKALGKGVVYHEDKELFKFDLSDKDTPLSILLDTNISENMKLKVEFTGQSSVYLNATLLGYEDQYTRHQPEITDVKRHGIYERMYYSPNLSYRGTQIAAMSTNPVTSVSRDEEVLVWFRAVNSSDYRESVIVEPMPKGFKYVKGSFKGGHNGVTHENGKLLIKLNGTFKDRWYRYAMVATDVGDWRHQPGAMILLSDHNNPKYGNGTSLKVFPKGKRTKDAYVFNKKELSELARLQFANNDFLSAEANINKLLAMKNADLTKDLAKMQLWIEKDKATPDARKLVNAFEVLDALDPDLDVPFSTLTKVADAYLQLNEHEQSYYVYRALVDASFSQDAVVASSLEKQDRKLDAIDVMQSLWMLYPESDTVGTSHFFYAQDLFASASKFKQLKTRNGVKQKLTEEIIYKESIELLQSYLALHPNHPSADQASYAICNSLFALKKYAGVTDRAQKAVDAYTKSELRNSFRYMVALGSFWQLKFDEAVVAAEVVAEGDSEDKNLATFITAQIYHAQGKIKEAKQWYNKVKDEFPDAATSLSYFEKKKLKIEEISLFDTAEKVGIEVEYRNISKVKLSIYKVDLMQLYLKHQNLSEITSINLAGIEPDFSLEKEIVQRVETNDEKTTISLPIKEDGAYLVICQGDYQYTSGMVLKSSLKIETQELVEGGKIRVNVKEKSSGKLLSGVHIKVIGSNNSTFQQGETDLRGVWESAALRGKVTVIARDKEGQYAFFRGDKPLVESSGRSDRSQIEPQKIDFNRNTFKKQESLNIDNSSKKQLFLERKGKSIKLNDIKKSK